MTVITLDYVNICTRQMADSIAFYGGLLGLDARPSPMTDDMTNNAWLCDGENRPVVHLMTPAGAPPGSTGIDGGAGSGSIDHVAFSCRDYPAFRARLDAEGVKMRENALTRIGLMQLFVTDPNGITVELNFHGAIPIA